MSLENNIFFRILLECLKSEKETNSNCYRQTTLLKFGFQKPLEKNRQTRITDFMPSEENGSDSK